jgi:SagB-type dehydrogenase family enzyme
VTVANDYIEAARAYHEITKHSYTSVRAGAYQLDWDNRPLPYKIYPQAGALALPRDLELARMPALQAIASPTDKAERALDLGALTRLLFCADGLTRRKRVGPEDYHFRAAASAGALYPIEIYVAAADVAEMEAGLYHFSPADLKMRGLRRGDWREVIARAAAMRPSIQNASAILLMSAIFWRSAWKYRARAYRYCFWDAGTIIANLLAAAAAEAIAAEVVTAFVDPEIESLLGIDGEREAPICLVALGATSKMVPASPALAPLELETIEISKEEVVFEPLIKMHRESRLESPDEVGKIADVRLPALPAGAAASSGERVSFEPIEAEGTSALGETILRRGSTRVFAREPIAAAELATILSVSSRHPDLDFPALTGTYLIVNAVDGIKPGTYYFHRDANAFELLKAGEFRGEAGYLCLEQPLGQDCSALIVLMADLERVMGVLGNRGYRDAHLEAGILGGRAYLAAYALDRGASGLTFYDDDTTKFFEPHAVGKSPLLMVAVGVPRSRATTK